MKKSAKCCLFIDSRKPEWKERYGKYPAEKLLYLLRDEVDSVAFEAVLKVLMQR